MKWYSKAAEQGHVEAQCAIGECYLYGEEDHQSYRDAVKWDCKAAEQGNMYGQHNLGRCYHWGLGVVQSWAQASNWYQKSAKQGCQAAKDALESLGGEL